MTLYVKPISALLTHDTQIFSNMDPYVIIKIGTQKKRSKTHKEGGKKPRWDEVFNFKPSLNTKSMEVMVMDEDTITDDHVGSANVELSKYLSSPGQHKQYISLTYKNRSAGKIYLSLRYEPASQPGSSFNNGMQANKGNSYGWGQQQPQQPFNQPFQQNSGMNQPQQPYTQPYQQNPGMSQPGGYNSGWEQNTSNSGWGQVPSQPIINNTQGAILANNLFGGMQQPVQQQPQQGYQGQQQSGSDVLGILGNILSNNSDHGKTHTSPPPNNSEWGSNPNNGNSGWGPNNNGWGANNGGSGW